MLAIDRELKDLIQKLSEKNIPHALCGGLAMAVHGFPRATLDIDLLALGESAALIKTAAAELGYTLGAAPMSFAAGKVKITRVSKVSAESEDILPLDILTLDPEIEKSIELDIVDWDGLKLQVVSRESLVRLKQLRNSHQDLADIENLTHE